MKDEWGDRFEDNGVEVHDGFFVFSPSMTWGEGQRLSDLTIVGLCRRDVSALQASYF